MTAMPGVLLEREAELGLLAEAVARLGDGAGGVVLVEGVPGIGKTALLEVALARAPSGVRVLRARGAELVSTPAFGTVRELFGPTLRAADPAARAELLAGPADLAAAALGLRPATDDRSRTRSTA